MEPTIVHGKGDKLRATTVFDLQDIVTVFGLATPAERGQVDHALRVDRRVG